MCPQSQIPSRWQALQTSWGSQRDNANHASRRRAEGSEECPCSVSVPPGPFPPHAWDDCYSSGDSLFTLQHQRSNETWGPQTQGKGSGRQGLKRYFAQVCVRKCGPSGPSFTIFKEDCHPGKLHSPPQQETEDFALEKLSGAERQSLHKNVYFIHF